MRMILEGDDRRILVNKFGLGAKATNAEIQAAVTQRLISGPPQPATPVGTTDPDAEAVIGQAVRDGKFSADRAAHYRERWARDPEGTRRTIASLAANAVPSQQFAGTPDGYPAEWLRTAPAHGGSRVHAD